jgi:outer membrane protein assembly factor BamB
VFALDVDTGQLKWRITADRLITRKLAVTDEDIYVAPRRGGLFRANREDGREIWRNPDADRFLAHNRLFTYARDRFGGMLVLDRATGTELSCLYLGDFVIPFSNDQTDRIYMGANNGLIICLHDRDHPKPLRLRAREYDYLIQPKPAPTPASAPTPSDERPADGR